MINLIKENFLAILYFLFGFLTSFSMVLQGKELYFIFGGVTLFAYFLFNLLEAIEEL